MCHWCDDSINVMACTQALSADVHSLIPRATESWAGPGNKARLCIHVDVDSTACLETTPAHHMCMCQHCMFDQLITQNR